jgi:riboflavin kinase/FMN adenylyltransferase
MDGNKKPIFFEVSGIVLKGKKKASAFGYPTANIACENDIPGGIYVGDVTWKGVSYSAAIYKEDGKNIIEAHLLDFSGNLYGEALTFRAFQKIRDVKIFSNQADLVAAIARDIETIKKLCSQE